MCEVYICLDGMDSMVCVVHVHVLMCLCLCVHACVKARGQCQMSSVALHTIFWSRVSHGTCSSSMQLDCVVSEFGGFCLLSAGISKPVLLHPDLSEDARNLNPFLVLTWQVHRFPQPQPLCRALLGMVCSYLGYVLFPCTLWTFS